MLFRNLLFPGLVLPAAVAAAVYLVAGLGARPRGRRGGGGLAVAAAFLATFVAISGWPRWPPVEATQRLAFLVAIAAVGGLTIGRLRGAARWVVAGLAVGLLLGLTLQTPIQHRWSPLEVVLWLAGLLAVGLALDGAFETSLGESAAPRLAVAVRLLLVGGTAVALGLSESARLAQLMGALACGLFVVEVLSRALRRTPWRTGDGLAPAIALYGLLLAGYFYAGLEPLPAILLVASFLLLPVAGGRSPWWLLAPLGTLLLALGLVVAGHLTKEEDPYDYYSATPAAVESPAAAET